MKLLQKFTLIAVLSCSTAAPIATSAYSLTESVNNQTSNTQLVANNSDTIKGQTIQEYNESVPRGSRVNEVDGGNPVFPQITLDNPFVDTTGKASDQFLAEMRARAKKIEAKGYQFGGFVYFDSNNEMWQVANDFGNHIGVGHSQTDNGIVMIIALNKKGKKSGLSPGSFITVGKGIQGLIPDSTIGRIYSEIYTPTLKQTGSWQAAHIAAIDELILQLSGEGSVNEESGELSAEGQIAIIILIVLIVLIVVVGLMFGSSGGGGGYYSSSSDSDYGGFGGFGGGDYGGGDYGGGGFDGGGDGN